MPDFYCFDKHLRETTKTKGGGLSWLVVLRGSIHGFIATYLGPVVRERTVEERAKWSKDGLEADREEPKIRHTLQKHA